MSPEQIASVAHEANRAYCLALGDTSQPAWADAPDWQRSSAVNGVKFHAANPDASAAASHECWLEQKRAEGWKYGPVKDPEKKEHPCFLPFEGLPPAQQAKDRLFKAISGALLDRPAPAPEPRGVTMRGPQSQQEGLAELGLALQELAGHMRADKRNITGLHSLAAEVDQAARAVRLYARTIEPAPVPKPAAAAQQQQQQQTPPEIPPQ